MAQKWSKATYNNIIAKVKKTIEQDIVNFIYEKMYESIYDVVYSYDVVTENLRRYDSKGGLGDMSTYSYDLIVTDTGFKLKVFTNSKARGDNEGDSLDEYIVEGKYTWTESKIYKDGVKRDFYRATLNNLIQNGDLHNEIKLRFALNGIKVN